MHFENGLKKKTHFENEANGSEMLYLLHRNQETLTGNNNYIVCIGNSMVSRRICNKYLLNFILLL